MPTTIPPSEVFSVQDVDLVRVPRRQTDDVGVWEKPPHVLGEKERPGIAEDGRTQFRAMS